MAAACARPLASEVLSVLASEAAAAPEPNRLDLSDGAERGAIIEHDGDIPRTFAEEFA